MCGEAGLAQQLGEDAPGLAERGRVHAARAAGALVIGLVPLLQIPIPKYHLLSGNARQRGSPKHFAAAVVADRSFP